MLKFFNGILDPRGYFFFLSTSLFFFLLFILLIFKCIYNFPSFQSYTHFNIETQGLLFFIVGVVLYLRIGGRPDIRMIRHQVHFRKGQDLNRVE
jgi:hypothetical protein